MQTKIIDPIAIRSFEKQNNIKLDEIELDNCLCAEGYLNIYRSGVWYNTKFDLILFPHGISNESPPEIRTPWMEMTNEVTGNSYVVNRENTNAD